jgi:hypothetical protein
MEVVYLFSFDEDDVRRKAVMRTRHAIVKLGWVPDTLAVSVPTPGNGTGIGVIPTNVVSATLEPYSLMVTLWKVLVPSSMCGGRISLRIQT